MIVLFHALLALASQEPTFVWWAQVKNAQGVEGWMANPREFDGMDNCA
jgi:hypothetical protein